MHKICSPGPLIVLLTICGACKDGPIGLQHKVLGNSPALSVSISTMLENYRNAQGKEPDTSTLSLESYAEIPHHSPSDLIITHTVIKGESWKDGLEAIAIFRKEEAGNLVKLMYRDAIPEDDLHIQLEYSPKLNREFLLVIQDFCGNQCADEQAFIYALDEKSIRLLFHEGISYSTAACENYENALRFINDSKEFAILLQIHANRGYDKNGCWPAGRPKMASKSDQYQTDRIRFSYKNGKLVPNKRVPDYRKFVGASSFE